MLNVDQRGVASLGFVVPFTRRFFAASILRGRDDLEILILQLRVDFLPAWQIEAASSPGCPGDDQNLLASKIMEVDDFSVPVRHREIRSDAGADKGAAEHRNFTQAPDASAGVGDDGLPDLLREAGQVEEFAVRQILRKRDAKIVAARALRLDLEIVDLRQIGLADPQILRIGLDFDERG